MLLLKDVLQFIKEAELFERCYAGRIDKSKMNVGCLYDREVRERTIALGGKQYNGYAKKPLSLLVRGTKNKDVSERLALEVHKFLDDSPIHEINGIGVYFINVLHDYPIDVTGEDEVFEYVIEFDIYFYEEA